LEEFKDENKRWEMYRDWNKVGNIPQKTIDNMEVDKLWNFNLFLKILEQWIYVCSTYISSVI